MAKQDERSGDDWSDFVGEVRERIAARQERAGELPPGPGDEAEFEARYEHLVRELVDLLEEVPEIEVEPHGPSGVRLRFPPTDREVRITSLDAQRFVHFVFSHATLGTLHRAEHHASRPFGDRSPDVPRLLRQILRFLVEGAEPKWLTKRSDPPRPARENLAPDPELELPLD